MQTRFVVEGVDGSGAQLYYTGKAGPEFVTTARGESFGYISKLEAENRAKTLNRMSEVHGVRFTCTGYPERADWFIS